MPAKLERQRARLATRLAGQATISRLPDPATATRDAAGGRVTTPQPVATGVPCHIGPLGTSTAERRYADQQTTRARLKATLRASADVQAQDTLTVGGQRYVVVGLLGPITDPRVVQAVVEVL